MKSQVNRIHPALCVVLWIYWGGFVLPRSCGGEDGEDLRFASDEVSEPPQSAPGGPHEALWRLLGIGPDEWTTGDKPTESLVRRLLQELPRIPWAAWHDARPASPVWQPGRPTYVQGILQHLARRELPDAADQGFNFDHWFQGTLQDNDGTLVGFHVRAIPAQWLPRLATLHDSQLLVACDGICVVDGRQPEVVATRLTWTPNRVEDKFGVGTGQVWLGQHGFDAGLWGAVQDHVELTIAEQPAFYQLLGLMAQCVPPAPPPAFEITRVLQSQEPRGQLGRLTGTLRRAVRIVVTNPRLQAETGLQDYFQLDLFVRTEVPVRVQLPDGTHRDFGSQYPVSVCVPGLPPGISAGEDLRQPIAVTAAYFKLWGHDSDFMAGNATTREQVEVAAVPDRRRPMQWTPLFVGWVPTPNATNDGPTAMARAIPGIVLSCLIVAIWFILVAYSRDGRRRAAALGTGEIDFEAWKTKKGEDHFDSPSGFS